MYDDKKIQSLKNSRYKVVKLTEDQKKKAEYLRSKMKLEEINGVDDDDTLCDAIELFANISVDMPLINDEKDFMKLHGVILPEDKNQRLEVLLKHTETVLPLMHEEHPDLHNMIFDMSITLGAIDSVILNCSEEEHDNRGLPEDEAHEDLLEIINYDSKEGPREIYFVSMAKYIQALLNRIRIAIQENDIQTLQAAGMRLDLLALNYDQAYRFHYFDKE